MPTPEVYDEAQVSTSQNRNFSGSHVGYQQLGTT